MQHELRDVLDNYFSTRIRLAGKAKIVGSADQKALLSTIPDQIQSYLVTRGLAHQFKIKGSIGNGNIARVPWVGIFRKEITENAENGYYIVLLFSENMSSCYLSLNQGITAVEQIYTKGFAAKKMREAATHALTYLECDPEAYRGSIDLASTGDLGRAYEAAAIVSFRYPSDNLPTEQRFFENLDHLLAHYETLFKLFGDNLHSLFSVSEEEFQQVVLEKAAQITDTSVAQTSIDPRSLSGRGTLGYIRSPIIAAEAIRAAQFNCEIDPTHWTFTSKAKKQRYVEAHHLIPISQQHRFETSLDIVANIVSLCATCHRMLHFGVEKEKRSILLSLLNQRKKKLAEKLIDVKAGDFLRFYAASTMIED